MCLSRLLYDGKCFELWRMPQYGVAFAVKMNR